MKIYNIASDEVIGAICGLAETNYRYTLMNIYPLINKLDEQRKILDSKYYRRLERDILAGCIMPPLTLAFVSKENKIQNIEGLSNFVNQNISHGFILDGIQRLTTLERASHQDGFKNEKEIFFNVIIADSKDKLLYRMITLNNGQKGMTPRHQIEILTKELFDFENLNIVVQTEKDKAEHPIKNSYSLGDISKGYMAFLTNNVHNENSKIIGEKMDEILVGRILDNDISRNEVEFYDIIVFAAKHSANHFCLTWLQTVNNFIGLSAGFNASYRILNTLNSEQLEIELKKFEEAFKILNVSKINLGKFRRELSKEFIQNLAKYQNYDSEELAAVFVELTITE